MSIKITAADAIERIKLAAKVRDAMGGGDLSDEVQVLIAIAERAGDVEMMIAMYVSQMGSTITTIERISHWILNGEEKDGGG